MLHEQDWQFPSLSRDLALIAVGIVLVAALVGAGIGVAADVLIHRHRQTPGRYPC